MTTTAAAAKIPEERVLDAIDAAYQEYRRWAYCRLVTDVAEQLGVRECTPDHGYIQQIVSMEFQRRDVYDAHNSPHDNDLVYSRDSKQAARRYELVFAGAAGARYIPRYQRWHKTLESARDEARRVQDAMYADPLASSTVASHPPQIYGYDRTWTA